MWAIQTKEIKRTWRNQSKSQFCTQTQNSTSFPKFSMARKCVDTIPAKKIKACSWEFENIHNTHLGIEEWAGLSQLILKRKGRRKTKKILEVCSFGVLFSVYKRPKRRLGATRYQEELCGRVCYAEWRVESPHSFLIPFLLPLLFHSPPTISFPLTMGIEWKVFPIKIKSHL